eukprot:1157009-Pelagomonas_calceolata.AAC.4
MNELLREGIGKESTFTASLNSRFGSTAISQEPKALNAACDLFSSSPYGTIQAWQQKTHENVIGGEQFAQERLFKQFCLPDHGDLR